MRGALGLRPRLLAALLATSLVTLGTAALALLPPLRERLRDQAVPATQRGDRAGRSRPSIRRCGTDCAIDSAWPSTRWRHADRRAKVFVVDGCRSRSAASRTYQSSTGSAPADASSAGDARTYRAACTGDSLRAGGPARRRARPDRRAVVRKPLTDVAGAVDEVTRRSRRPPSSGLGRRCCSASASRPPCCAGSSACAAPRCASPPRARAPRIRATTGRDEIGDLAALVRRDAGRAAASGGGAAGVRRDRLARAAHAADLAVGDARAARRRSRRGHLDIADARDQIAAARGELRRLGNLAAELLDL